MTAPLTSAVVPPRDRGAGSEAPARDQPSGTAGGLGRREVLLAGQAGLDRDGTGHRDRAAAADPGGRDRVGRDRGRRVGPGSRGDADGRPPWWSRSPRSRRRPSRRGCRPGRVRWRRRGRRRRRSPIGIITEMLIAPPLPPFDSAAALFFPVAETLTAPLDVTEPALVISAVTSAASGDLGVGRGAGAGEQAEGERERLGRRGVGAGRGDGHRAGGGDRAADRGEHRALDPCGRQGHADAEPERRGAGVGLGQGDVRAGGGHGDGTGDGDRATGHGGGHVRVLADVRERGRGGPRRQGRTGRARWSRRWWCSSGPPRPSGTPPTAPTRRSRPSRRRRRTRTRP